MTAISIPKAQTQSQQGFPFLLLLALLAIAIALASIAYGTHAVARHGTEARIARECADRPEFIFHNPQLNRWGYICKTSTGKWGVVILNEAGKEITAFIKNKMTRFQDVLRYMQNAGYELIH